MSRYTPNSSWPKQLTCKCGYHAATTDELVAHTKGDKHVQMRLALGQISLNEYRLWGALKNGRIIAGV